MNNSKSQFTIVLMAFLMVFSACSDNSDEQETANNQNQENANQIDNQQGDADQAEVMVYFSEKGGIDCSQTKGKTRTVEAETSQDKYRNTLIELLEGPDEEEDDVVSLFSSDTASALNNLEVIDNTAFIDLQDLREIIPSGNSSCNAQALTAQIDQTLTQFDAIDDVVISLEGSVFDFYEWLQLGCPNYQEPVCGELEGELINYDNFCSAQRAGASEISPGVCPEEGEADEEASDLSVPNESTWVFYNDNEASFEVAYPDSLLSLEESANLLYHEVSSVEDTSFATGASEGLIRDLTIRFTNETNECRQYRDELIGEAEEFRYQLISGRSYTLGAEGEGVIYYCVENRDGEQIFQIERGFVTEAYNSQLSEDPEFLSFNDQNKLFDSVMETFKLDSEYYIDEEGDAWESYRDAEDGYLVSYPSNLLEFNQEQDLFTHVIAVSANQGEIKDMEIIFSNDQLFRCDNYRDEYSSEELVEEFQFANVSGRRYLLGSEEEGTYVYCVENQDGEHIFMINRFFALNIDNEEFIPIEQQNEIFTDMMSTFDLIE
jgi:spore germination protein GerM